MTPRRPSPFLLLAAALLAAACGSGGSTTEPVDPFHQACLGRINELRATKALPALGRWQAAEACVAAQATADETSGTPHGAWIAGGSTCNGSAQNECLGFGAAGITACLDLMWAEKDLPACAACDTCAGNSGCAGCDFPTCGHYVNMRSGTFTEVACGVSALGGWVAINFR